MMLFFHAHVKWKGSEGRRVEEGHSQHENADEFS